MNTEEPSEVVKFYTGSTIFLTGGTGFLGRIFLEKLLRVCSDLERIYVLVRAKKGKDPHTRFKEIFDGPSFEPLKTHFPNFGSKVTMMNGDISLPNLGLNDEDKEKLISTVNIIIHCAATVRFDQKLKVAAFINVRSVIDLIAMAKEMKNLRAMVYISTAFSNCVRKQIDETFYDPPINGRKLISLVDCLEDDKLDKIEPIILDKYPNTYVFTKAVAEDIVKNEGGFLPIGVIRPSIVIASVKEPVPGWIDNLYGATGVLIGAALGVLRSIYGRKENIAEMVPADYVVNCAIVALWDIASKSINCNKEESNGRTKSEEDVNLYNYVSSTEKKITWDEYAKLAEKHAVKVPSEHQVWHYFFTIRSSKLGHFLAVFFYHTIPAYFVDFIVICLGKKPMMVKGYERINKFADVIGYFSSREWVFSNNNVQGLWKKLGKRDQELFYFSMKMFDWDEYFHTYVRGARQYLLKDPLHTVPQGRIKYYKLFVAHHLLLAFLLFFVYKLLSTVFSLIF